MCLCKQKQNKKKSSVLYDQIKNANIMEFLFTKAQ